MANFVIVSGILFRLLHCFRKNKWCIYTLFCNQPVGWFIHVGLLFSHSKFAQGVVLSSTQLHYLRAAALWVLLWSCVLHLTAPVLLHGCCLHTSQVSPSNHRNRKFSSRKRNYPSASMMWGRCVQYLPLPHSTVSPTDCVQGCQSSHFGRNPEKVTIEMLLLRVVGKNPGIA